MANRLKGLQGYRSNVIEKVKENHDWGEEVEEVVVDLGWNLLGEKVAEVSGLG